MLKDKKILAVIPARGGSKGVKNKNLRIVGNQPLIYWSITEALKVNYIDELIVSTDSRKIADVSKEIGAKVLMRPPGLADDKTPMTDTLKYLLGQLSNLKKSFDILVLLQPTAPMRTFDDIDSAIKKFIMNPNSESLVSIYKVEDCHPSRMYSIKDNALKKIMDEPSGSLRQDLDHVYHRNGAIYICNTKLLIEENKLISENSDFFIMNKEVSINIDSEQDLAIADFLMKEKLLDK
mgnify:FL=1